MTPPAAQFVDAATSPLPTNKYAILDGDTIAKLNLRDGDAGVSRPQAAANSSGQHAADQAMNTTTTPLILTSEVLASIAPPLPLHLVSPVASDEVRELENVFIPMKDGIRLAARIWLPKTAGESNRVPAVFELLPCRFAWCCMAHRANSR